MKKYKNLVIESAFGSSMVYPEKDMYVGVYKGIIKNFIKSEKGKEAAEEYSKKGSVVLNKLGGLLKK